MNPSSSEHLRLGVVGLGYAFTDYHLPHWDQVHNVSISAISDADFSLAAEFAPKFQAKAFRKPEELVSKAEIDALYLLIPPWTHGNLERIALERKIPFFVEKPIALDLMTARNIEQKVRETNLITSVGYHRRYSKAAIEIHRHIEGRQRILIAGIWHTVIPPNKWWGRLRLSGGQLVEQVTHLLDLFRFFFGEVESVTAHHELRITQLQDFDIPDCSVLSCKFKSGALGSLSATCAMPSGHHRVGLQIVVDGRALDLRGDKLEVYSANTTDTFNFGETYGKNPFAEEANVFFNAVRSGNSSEILSSYSDAIKSLRLSLAARMSAEQGRTVSLEELD